MDLKKNGRSVDAASFDKQFDKELLEAVTTLERLVREGLIQRPIDAYSERGAMIRFLNIKVTQLAAAARATIVIPAGR